MKTFQIFITCMASLLCLVLPASAQRDPGGPGLPSISLSITQPADGARFDVNTPVPIKAVAIDLNGAVYRLEFFAGDQRIGVSEIFTLVPIPPGEPVYHEIVWNRAPAGRHELRVRASNLTEFPVWSDPVTIIVGEGEPASLTFTKPPEGSRWKTPGEVPLEVTAVDPDGEIRRVEFFAGDQLLGVSQIVTRDAEIPGRPRTHYFIWTNPPTGTHRLQAKAVSAAGESVSSGVRTIEVTEEAQHLFEFLQPADSSEFADGEPIFIQVITIVADSYVGHLEFLANGQMIGDSVINFFEQPKPGTPIVHEFLWQDAPTGQHRLTVQTILDDGSVLESSDSRTIRVGPGADLPVVSLAVLDGELSETGSDTAAVVVQRGGGEEQPLTVFLHWAGTATPGQDYAPVPTEVRFEPGQTSLRLRVEGKYDEVSEGDEVVELAVINPPDTILYHIAPDGGQAVLTLHDGPGDPALPVVTVNAGRRYALEGDRFNRGDFFLQRTGDVTQELSVSFNLSGSATRGTDYHLLLDPCDDCLKPDIEVTEDTVTFPAGQEFLTLGVVASFDGTLDVAEPVLEDVRLQIYTPPVIAIVGAKPPYIAGIPDQATVDVVERRDPDAAEITLITPTAGDALPLGSPNLLRAIAVDPEGSIRRVEFWANEQRIGVSEITTEEVDIPGKLRVHEFRWSLNDPAAAGPYTLSAQAASAGGVELESNPVPITVGEVDPQLPVISISPGKSPAYETGDLKSRTGGFVLSRHGGTDGNSMLTVFVAVSGTAAMGRDYEWVNSPVDLVGNLPSFGAFLPVIFPLGANQVDFNFTAFPDDLVEGTESVVLEVIDPPILALSPLAASYVVGEPRIAEVVIEDTNLQSPSIVLTQPAPGTVFQVGESIPMVATAVHPDHGIEVIQFFADGQKIGQVNYCCDTCDCLLAPEGQPFTASFDWSSATQGTHVLLARTVLGSNEVMDSEPVTIVVGGVGAASLVIVAPTEGALFKVGDEVTIDTVGQDPDSLVSTVEFFANGEKIGESCFLCVVDGIFPPGTPLHNQIQWKPTKPGRFELTAIGQFGPQKHIASPPVTVLVDGQNSGPRIFIASPPDGSTLAAGANIPVIAVGTGREGGITDVVLLVDGVPVKESHIVFIRPPSADEEVRHEFMIRLRPGHHELVVRDLDDASVVSPVVRVFVTGSEPGITWISPREGTEYLLGQAIILEVQSGNPDETFNLVEFYDGERLIGRSQPECADCPLNQHRFEWQGAAEGPHALTARGVGPNGAIVVSDVRHVTVRSDGQSESFVSRTLPSYYETGKAFTVQLEADPPATAIAYVIEEVPPFVIPAPGLPEIPAPLWIVTAISHDGVFDPQTGKVKFGPFFDHEPRTFTYEIVPNLVMDLARFTGVGIADGKSTLIAGDQELLGNVRHPADREPADDVLSGTELTGYAAAWKREQPWATGPNPIPVDYVTRAAALWKGGEQYVYDASAGSPPFCWFNGVTTDPATEQAAASTLFGRAVRFQEQLPNGSVRTTIRVTPATGVYAFAIEERLSANAVVSEVTSEGEFSASSGILRWGPFYAGNGGGPSVSYLRTDSVATVATQGIVSFDGQNLPIHSEASGPDESTEHLAGVDPLHDGSFQISLEATALVDGAEYELEVSTNLKDWTRVGAFSTEQDTGFARDSGASGANVRFYRAVRVQ